VKSNEYMEIIRHLLQENKKLKEEVQVLESILHSNITILGEEE
tara:strand:+ start:189 stop:317 length:129 start_codon:yes stop_codon:yes gene_type:complete